MTDVYLDKSRSVRLRARINEASVPRVFVFMNSGNPRTTHSITSYDFELIVFKRANSLVRLFTLRLGDGLTIQGDDDHKLRVEVSDERALQRADTNFYRLRSIAEDHTWLNGPFEFHNGESDNVESEDVVKIYQNG